MKEQDGGFIITLLKDNLIEEQLIKRGLNDRQLKAVQYIKENTEITNGIDQEINNVGKTTATEALKLMVE